MPPKQDNVVEIVEAPVQHQISRDLLAYYMNGLKSGTDTQSFVTPAMAFKVIDFVYLLKQGAHVDKDVGDDFVHKWYKASVDSNCVIPFNQRTKTENEIISLVGQEFGLKEVAEE